MHARASRSSVLVLLIVLLFYCCIVVQCGVVHRGKVKRGLSRVFAVVVDQDIKLHDIRSGQCMRIISGDVRQPRDVRAVETKGAIGALTGAGVGAQASLLSSLESAGGGGGGSTARSVGSASGMSGSRSVPALDTSGSVRSGRSGRTMLTATAGTVSPQQSRTLGASGRSTRREEEYDHRQGHTRAVTCVWLGSFVLVSGSADNEVRVWALLTGRCQRVLQGHTGESTGPVVRTVQAVRL